MLERTLQEDVAQVSRSFAFVMEQLREPLRSEVQVGYLVFRLGDNIEDTASLAPAAKEELLEGFLESLESGRPFLPALQRAGAQEWEGLTPGEQTLNSHADLVVHAFRSLDEEARTELLRQARIMFRGMAHVQKRRENGYVWLQDTRDLEEYCYYVAGTVGDYLTNRFLARLGDVRPAARAQMLGAGRSLALVLQVTNILRDVADDHSQGNIFYPKSFLGNLPPTQLTAPAHRLRVLKAGVLMARWLLPAVDLAEVYIDAVPTHAADIRLFCTIPYAMALRTLEVSVGNPDLFGPEPVRLSRAETKLLVLASKAVTPSRLATRALLGVLRRRLHWKVARLAES